MCNYYLGGKDHFTADREAVGLITEKFPQATALARANRNFLVRAARFCAERGMEQFIEIGTGIPTSPAVHEVVRSVRAGARVVGAAHDPVALCHARALLDDGAGVRIIEGDLRRPAETLADPVLAQLINLDRPVAVLLAATLDFITDDAAVADGIAALRSRMAPGSSLVISHTTSTGSDPQVIERFTDVYAKSTSPARARTREQILALFGDFDLVEPGLVDVQHWNPDRGVHGRTAGMRVLGAVGRKLSN